MGDTKKPMRFDTREPCASCPYRRDAKPGLWAPEEFEKLLASERITGDLQSGFGLGVVYGCHGTAKLPELQVCGGWLLDQKRRDLPSIMLRATLIRSDEAARCLEEITDGGHALYDSIEEMIAAQGFDE